MTKRGARMLRAGCGLAFAAAGIGLVIFPTTGAGADQGIGPAQQGWWTAVNPGPPAPAPPTPPDVPSKGLLVQGGANSPTSYAGLVYQLPAGSSAGILTLDVTSGSATTPSTTLEVCSLDIETLNADQGGPMSEAPAYNCAQSTTAQPAAGGGSYQFSVGSLATNSVLAIAILPTSPSDRVVFDPPSAQSLAVSASGGGAASSDFTPGQAFSGQAGTSGSTGAGSSVTALNGVSAPAALGSGLSSPSPAAGPAPALAPTQAGSPTKSANPPNSNSLLPNNLAAGSPSTGEDSPQPLAIGLAIAGVIAAIALWGSASRIGSLRSTDAEAAGHG